MRAIDSVEAAFIAKEIDSKTTKISMRSKKIDVADVCAEYSGGGHTYAAGCVIKSSMPAAVKKILSLVKDRV